MGVVLVTIQFETDGFDREKMAEVMVDNYGMDNADVDKASDAELVALYVDVQVNSGIDYDGIIGLKCKEVFHRTDMPLT